MGPYILIVFHLATGHIAMQEFGSDAACAYARAVLRIEVPGENKYFCVPKNDPFPAQGSPR